MRPICGIPSYYPTKSDALGCLSSLLPYLLRHALFISNRPPYASLAVPPHSSSLPQWKCPIGAEWCHGQRGVVVGSGERASVCRKSDSRHTGCVTFLSSQHRSVGCWASGEGMPTSAPPPPSCQRDQTSPEREGVGCPRGPVVAQLQATARLWTACCKTKGATGRQGQYFGGSNASHRCTEPPRGFGGRNTFQSWSWTTEKCVLELQVLSPVGVIVPNEHWTWAQRSGACPSPHTLPHSALSCSTARWSALFAKGPIARRGQGPRLRMKTPRAFRGTARALQLLTTAARLASTSSRCPTAELTALDRRRSSAEVAARRSGTSAEPSSICHPVLLP